MASSSRYANTSSPTKPISSASKCESALILVARLRRCAPSLTHSLLEHGGIYLDIDTFIIHPFTSASLMQYDTVMALEANPLTFFRRPMSDDEMDPKGLCNAVIIARPGAEFLRRWLMTYENFNELYWAEHSVVGLPLSVVTRHVTTLTT